MGFIKDGEFLPVERLSASREGLCSIELVHIFWRVLVILACSLLTIKIIK
jgi:hypothetical protein